MSTPDPDDARAPRLAVTPAGRDALRDPVERSDAARATQLARSGLTVDDLDAARRVLRALDAALEP